MGHDFMRTTAGHERDAGQLVYRDAKRREHCPAATLAADFPLDGCAAADTIDFIDEVPRPFVGHVHGLARSGDRTAIPNGLQQLDLARPDTIFRVEIDTNTQGWERCRRRFSHARLTMFDLQSDHIRKWVLEKY